MDRAKQMMEYDQVLGEKPLFHGTRTNKPEAIFKGDASFDMRYCHSGLWGRGNYFAVNASYSIICFARSMYFLNSSLFWMRSIRLIHE